MDHSDLKLQLVPITGDDASVAFNPRKHRVLFWKWHDGIEGTLGFVEGLRFDPLHPIDQYTSALVEFISSSPRGSNVPWIVIKRFLGIASGEDVDGVSFAACFPGLDSLGWSKILLADAMMRRLVGITIPSHTFEIRFNQDGWIKFDIVNSVTGTLLGWKATVPPLQQVDLSSQQPPAVPVLEPSTSAAQIQAGSGTASSLAIPKKLLVQGAGPNFQIQPSEEKRKRLQEGNMFISSDVTTEHSTASLNESGDESSSFLRDEALTRATPARIINDSQHESRNFEMHPQSISEISVLQKGGYYSSIAERPAAHFVKTSDNPDTAFYSVPANEQATANVGTEELVFHSLLGNNDVYDSAKHRVVFWQWFEGKKNHLAFVPKEMWSTMDLVPKGRRQVDGEFINLFWLNSLVRYAFEHPEGTDVPLSVIHRFLGVADSICSDFTQCIPGLDSHILSGMKDPSKSAGIVAKGSRKYVLSLSPPSNGSSLMTRFALERAVDGRFYGWTSVKNAVRKRNSENFGGEQVKKMLKLSGPPNPRRASVSLPVTSLSASASFKKKYTPSSSITSTLSRHSFPLSGGEPLWQQVKALEEDCHANAELVERLTQEIAQERAKLATAEANMQSLNAQTQASNMHVLAEQTRGNTLYMELNRLQNILKFRGEALEEESRKIGVAMKAAEDVKDALLLAAPQV